MNGEEEKPDRMRDLVRILEKMHSPTPTDASGARA